MISDRHSHECNIVSSSRKWSKRPLIGFLFKVHMQRNNPTAKNTAHTQASISADFQLWADSELAASKLCLFYTFNDPLQVALKVEGPLV